MKMRKILLTFACLISFIFSLKLTSLTGEKPLFMEKVISSQPTSVQAKFVI